MVVMMVMIMRGHKFATAMTAFGLNRVSALASSLANILTPSQLRFVISAQNSFTVFFQRELIVRLRFSIKPRSGAADGPGEIRHMRSSSSGYDSDK